MVSHSIDIIHETVPCIISMATDVSDVIDSINLSILSMVMCDLLSSAQSTLSGCTLSKGPPLSWLQ